MGIPPREQWPSAIFEVVTPELASVWLTTNMDNNRLVSAHLVKTYRRDMLAGAWAVNHEAIAFNVRGELYEGQHRLRAIVESGVPCLMLVCRNMPMESIVGSGRGRPRSFADILRMMGDNSISSSVVAAATLIGGMTGEPRRSTHQISTLVQKYGEHIYPIDGIIPHRRNLGQASLRAGLAFCRPANEDMVDQFAARISDGEGLEKGNPILTLRNYLLFGSTRDGETGRKQRFLATCSMVERYISVVSTTSVRIRPSVFLKYAESLWGFTAEDMHDYASLSVGVNNKTKLILEA